MSLGLRFKTDVERIHLNIKAEKKPNIFSSYKVFFLMLTKLLFKIIIIIFLKRPWYIPSRNLHMHQKKKGRKIQDAFWKPHQRLVQCQSISSCPNDYKVTIFYYGSVSKWSTFKVYEEYKRWVEAMQPDKGNVSCKVQARKKCLWGII